MMITRLPKPKIYQYEDMGKRHMPKWRENSAGCGRAKSIVGVGSLTVKIGTDQYPIVGLQTDNNSRVKLCKSKRNQEWVSSSRFFVLRKRKISERARHFAECTFTPKGRKKIPVARLRPPPRKHCKNKGKMDAKRSETSERGK
jgi:hypothetical protein